MRPNVLSLFAVAAAMPLLAGCGGTGISDPPSPKPRVRVERIFAPTLAANERAARRDAAALVKAARLPAGAVPVAREPSGDNGYLKPAQAIEADSAHALSHGWWIVSAPVSRVVAYLNAHRPPGSSAAGTGSAGDTRTGTSAQMVSYAWPAVGVVLGERELQLTVTSLPGGRSGVMAEAQSDWIVPRSLSEVVPSGATVVRVRLQRGPAHAGSKLGPVLQALITDPSKVARAISLVDSLAVQQPIVLNCPMYGSPTGSLTVTYSAGPAGPALAQAKTTFFAIWPDGGVQGCDPISFWIHGHMRTALVGTTFAGQIERLAGLPLSKARFGGPTGSLVHPA